MIRRPLPPPKRTSTTGVRDRFAPQLARGVRLSRALGTGAIAGRQVVHGNGRLRVDRGGQGGRVFHEEAHAAPQRIPRLRIVGRGESIVPGQLEGIVRGAADRLRVSPALGPGGQESIGRQAERVMSAAGAINPPRRPFQSQVACRSSPSHNEASTAEGCRQLSGSGSSRKVTCRPPNRRRTETRGSSTVITPSSRPSAPPSRYPCPRYCGPASRSTTERPARTAAPSAAASGGSSPRASQVARDPTMTAASGSSQPVGAQPQEAARSRSSSSPAAERSLSPQ